MPKSALIRALTGPPTLGLRLALGFGTLVIIAVAVVAIATAQLSALGRQNDETISKELQRMLKVQEVDRHVQGHGTAMARLLSAPRLEREHIYPMIDHEEVAVDSLFQSLIREMTDKEDAARLSQLQSTRQRYREVFSEVADQLELGNLSAASGIFDGAGASAMRALFEASQKLLAHEQRKLALLQHEERTQIRRSRAILIALATIMIALATLLAWRITAAVTRPLASVRAYADRIAEGDYASRVAITTDDELGRVGRAMNSMADAVAAREEEIARIAYIDSLTGLPNRLLLRRFARQDGRLSSGTGLSVILIDVARLRAVNELLGFDVGDEICIEVRDRLRRSLESQSDWQSRHILARLPGGVFALAIAGDDRNALDRLGERIDADISGPMTLHGHTIDVSMVYALATGTLTSRDDDDRVLRLDEALQQAELALGEAKRSRRRFAWYAPSDEAQRARQLSLLSELRKAIDTDALEMWLQPKQCLRTGRIVGLEALVRWRHPQRGYISPAEFIPFAERTGHIGLISSKMIENAARLLSQWSEQRPELSIAVNVSALDIRDDTFVSRVARILREHSVPQSRLRLEITESSVMEDADLALPSLLGLRDLGVQLSIDDFGTGYSSLAYLQRLPVNELKIDRSFVSRADESPAAQALLKTIIELGHGINMLVTAEGIEREEELRLLTTLGCDVAQGYLISKPMPLAAVSAYLNRHAPLSANPAVQGNSNGDTAERAFETAL